MQSADLKDFFNKQESDYRVEIEKWEDFKKEHLLNVQTAEKHINEAKKALEALTKDKEKLEKKI